MGLTPGTRMGRYEVRAPLGAGGMGEVYLAWDRDLERDVAVKVLGDGAEDVERTRRFTQEAKAASALNHPNVVHVYDIGSQDGVLFIAMEVVEGETLRKRISRGTLALGEALDIGCQVAAGMAAAHKAGIVHRDIKPENVIIRPDGYAKVLDFGLAKLRESRRHDAATVLKTAPGTTMGTLGYMAPEQLEGREVTPAADVFSIGVVLYEMVSGGSPFEGKTAAELIAAILTKEPRPISAPPSLQRVIVKALAKEPAQRYADAGELLNELRDVTRETGAPRSPASGRPSPARRLIGFAAGTAFVALIIFGVMRSTRARQVRHAQESVKEAQQLLSQRRFAEAYEAAQSVAKVIPDDERVRDVIARSASETTIESDPPGATVFLQRFNGPAERVQAGTTPLSRALPYADYVLTLEKPGYATVTTTLPKYPFFVRGVQVPQLPMHVGAKMIASAKVPDGMVFVQGGEYRLSGWSRPTDRPVVLQDYFIDRYEVSNRDFEQFVRAGGYRRRELWKTPFVDGGRTLSFEEAMEKFRDTTGRPGPRRWTGGAPPPGRENYPVADVTWYEASAFAEWKGKKLPTIYEWERAARYPIGINPGSSFPWGVVGEGVDTTERANFLGKGTLPVDAMPFGLSRWGAYNMAGNVAEWCRNPLKPGYVVRGGGWNDAVYVFGRTGSYPPLFSSSTLGFRCVRETAGGDQGDFALSVADFVPEYKPVDDQTFEEIRKRYDYAKRPLNARVIEVKETPDWRSEKISYEGVPGSNALAYLYLPVGFPRPVQVIVFSPASDVASGWRTLAASIEIVLGPSIRSGRAVFAVALEGYRERPRAGGSEEPDSRSNEFVDFTVHDVTEIRRGIDYLETRSDIDPARIGFYAVSAGSAAGVVLAGVEPRFRSIMLNGSGIRPSEISDAPAANRINFAPRIRGPKLMIQGRYDESAPLKRNAEPLFNLMSEPKRMQLYDGGHVPPVEVIVPAIEKWFDETMGPVQ